MRIPVAVLSMLLSLNIFSQDISRNIFFAEASGVTGIYSVNYERLLFKNNNVNMGIRMGFAYSPDLLHYNSRMLYPISLSMIKNITKNHFLEFRAGLSNNLYFYEDWSGKGLGDSTNNYIPPKKLGYTFVPSIGIGYRYQPKTKGLFFNLLAQRILYFSGENWYGNLSVGLGYAF